MKRFAVVSMTGALLLSLVMTGCNGGAQETSEPDYADDEVIAAMADGLEKRFDIADDRRRLTPWIRSVVENSKIPSCKSQ